MADGTQRDLRRKHKGWRAVLVVCSSESLTYTQRESGKLKKSFKCIIPFLCDAHLHEMWKSFRQLVVQGHMVGERQMKPLVRNLNRGRNKLESCCLLTCPLCSTHTGLWCAHLHQDAGTVGTRWGQMWRPSRKGRIFLQSCESCQAFGLSFATGLQIFCFLYSDKLT